MFSMNVFTPALVYLAVHTALVQSRYNTATFISAAPPQVSSTSRRSSWTSRSSSTRIQRRIAGRLHIAEFDQGELAHQLEGDFRADLARLALKFGSMVESVDNIESVRVSELDG